MLSETVVSATRGAAHAGIQKSCHLPNLRIAGRRIPDGAGPSPPDPWRMRAVRYGSAQYAHEGG